MKTAKSVLLVFLLTTGVTRAAHNERETEPTFQQAESMLDKYHIILLMSVAVGIAIGTAYGLYQNHMAWQRSQEPDKFFLKLVDAVREGNMRIVLPSRFFEIWKEQQGSHDPIGSRIPLQIKLYRNATGAEEWFAPLFIPVINTDTVN